MEQLKGFAAFRKEGIKMYNLEQLKKENPILERERRSKAETDIDNLKMCSTCGGFYAAKYISRHLKTCQIDSAKMLSSLPMTLIQPIDDNIRVTDDFKGNILAKFRSDSIGKLCQTDPIIITIGLRLYDKMKRKMDKVTEVRMNFMYIL